MTKKHAKMPEEQKEKIRQSLRGRKRKKPMSADHKRKIGLSNLGKKRSLATRQKLAAGREGKHHTCASRIKMSVSHLKDSGGVPITRRPNACVMLKMHADELRDDPEHLKTEFLQELIGINCNRRKKAIIQTTVPEPDNPSEIIVYELLLNTD